jgi:CDP-diacylglycerol--glycerol-3-phosphate 3-phosphatidyltransferase
VLSIFRILLLPPIVASLRNPETKRKALFYIGLAMLTDALDGPLARRRREVSSLGKVLDPVADKLLLDTIAFTLSKTHRLPWWITALLISRDVSILLAGLHIYRRKGFFTTSQMAGKATTLTLTVAMLLYIADGPRSGKPALSVALLLAAISLWQYGSHFVEVMREKEIPDLLE